MIKIQKKEKEIITESDMREEIETPNLDKFEKKFYFWTCLIVTIITVYLYMGLIYIPIVITTIHDQISKGFSLYLIPLFCVFILVTWWFLYDVIEDVFYGYFIKKRPLLYQEWLKWHIEFLEQERKHQEKELYKFNEI